jgi:hypothetical protein
MAAASAIPVAIAAYRQLPVPDPVAAGATDGCVTAAAGTAGAGAFTDRLA